LAWLVLKLEPRSLVGTLVISWSAPRDLGSRTPGQRPVKQRGWHLGQKKK